MNLSLLFWRIIYRRKEVDIMAQTKSYATKKKGKTEVYPFWNLEDIKKMIDWFINHKEWDGYLITMLELLLGRRIGDTVSMKWSDFYYENGNKKTELDDVEEQKTGKITRDEFCKLDTVGGSHLVL